MFLLTNVVSLVLKLYSLTRKGPTKNLYAKLFFLREVTLTYQLDLKVPLFPIGVCCHTCNVSEIITHPMVMNASQIQGATDNNSKRNSSS